VKWGWTWTRCHCLPSPDRTYTMLSPFRSCGSFQTYRAVRFPRAGDGRRRRRASAANHTRKAEKTRSLSSAALWPCGQKGDDAMKKKLHIGERKAAPKRKQLWTRAPGDCVCPCKLLTVSGKEKAIAIRITAPRQWFGTDSNWC
jgi:hypothetical protein